MHTASSTAKDMRARQRIIILFSLLGILLTGTLVGLITTIPMYQSVRAHIEQVNMTGAIAQGTAIENQLARYHSLAQQFTSRTEIRKRLERYVDGDMSLNALREYSQPRLAEPARHIADLAAMVRYAPDLQIVAAVGPLANRVRDLEHSPKRFDILNFGDANETTLIRVAAPILNPAGDPVGLDVLYFYTQTLVPLLRDFGTYDHQVELFLVSRKSLKAMIFDQEYEQTRAFDLEPYRQKRLAVMADDKPGIYPLDENQPFSLIHVPFADKDLGLVIKIPDKFFYQAAHQDLIWALFSVIAMLILGGILSHYTINPLIRRLISQAHKIESHAMELRLAASVFEHSQEAIVISDPNMLIVRANHGFKQTLGLEENHNASGQTLIDFIATECMENDDGRTFKDRIKQSESWQGEVWYRFFNHDEKETIPTLQSVTAVKDDEGKAVYFIHIFKDISDNKAAEERMRQLANNDSLTGLPNRNSLMTSLQETIRDHQEGDCFTVMFIDLDKFKPVNDDYGHQIGDEVLKQVAQRIRRDVRADDLVGRLGGDEFLMVIKTLPSLDNVEQIAQKIIDHLSDPFNIDGLNIYIGASIGIAHFPKDGQTADDIVNAADMAMYRAKQEGGNRYCY